MPLSIERKVTGGFAFALAFLSVIGIVSYLSVSQVRRDAARVRHSQEIMARLQLLLGTLTDAEVAQRGYTIRGDEKFLEPHQEAVRDLDTDLQQLWTLTADDLGQQRRLEALASLVAERIAVWHANVELRHSLGFEVPRGEIARGRGNPLADQFRRLVADMEDAERASLAEWETRARQSAAVTQAVIVGGGMLAFGFVGVALTVIKRDFAGRRRAEAALREAHDQLERRVRERTAELSKTNGWLRASEEHFRLLVDGVQDYAIIMLDPGGCVVSWNDGAERITGWRADEIMGAHVSQFSPPEEVAAGKPGRKLAVADADNRIEEEGWRLRKDGSRFWANIVVTALRDERGQLRGFAKVTRDMTERRRVSQTLQENEMRLAGIISSAMDGIITVDEGQRMILVNPAAETMFRCCAAELLGQPLERLIPERFRAEHDRHLQTFRQTNVTRRMMGNLGTIYGLRATGEEFPLEASISQTEVASQKLLTVILRDITERKQAEDKLQAQLARVALLNQITRAIGERQHLSSILQVVIGSLEEHLPAEFCCVALHDPAAHVLTVTRVGLRSAALAPEMALPEHAHLAIDANGLSECIRGQLVYAPDTRQMPRPFMQQLAHRGLCSLVMAPLLVESQVFGVLMVARRPPHSFSSGECEFLRQLSEHVGLAAHQTQLYSALQQAYDDLRQTQQAVLQQERLRALGQMASGIAHDINNAISPVALYTEALLESEPNLSARARRYLETIHRAIDDVARTVARMREFYRQREPQLTLMPVQLNPLIQQVVELTRARWSDIPQQHGHVIQVHTELAPNLPDVLGVESELREALTNLIFNAVDAMPEGGTLTLQTAASTGTSTPVGAQAWRHAVLEVADTGMGMDEETRRQCLEPFFTTKGERGTELRLTSSALWAEERGCS